MKVKIETINKRGAELEVSYYPDEVKFEGEAKVYAVIDGRRYALEEKVAELERRLAEQPKNEWESFFKKLNSK